jgi:hypothetical protein
MSVAFARRGIRVEDVLNEKLSFSHVLDCCSDDFTKNEVAQEELNNGPTT